MSTGPKGSVPAAKKGTSKRGGARPGSGPKPREFNSRDFILALAAECERREKSGEGSLAEIACNIAWGNHPDGDIRTQVAMIRELYGKLTPAGLVAKSKENKEVEVAVKLPKMDPDPSEKALH